MSNFLYNLYNNIYQLKQLNQPIFFSEEDLYCNFNNLDKYNIIFVVGPSGSGKTTLAKILQLEYNYKNYKLISLDLLTHCLYNSIKHSLDLTYLEHNTIFDPIIIDFLKSKYGLNAIFEFKKYIDQNPNQNMPAELLNTLLINIFDFINHNPGINIIIEGLQLIRLSSFMLPMSNKYDKYKTYPFVFKRTSIIKCLFRKFLRTFTNIPDVRQIEAKLYNNILLNAQDIKHLPESKYSNQIN